MAIGYWLLAAARWFVFLLAGFYLRVSAAKCRGLALVAFKQSIVEMALAANNRVADSQEPGANGRQATTSAKAKPS